MIKNLKTNFVGFTLIELLVVISIIGVLAGLVLVSFLGSQRQARDTRRKNDLKEYHAAVINYAGRNRGRFPAHTSVVDAQTMCDELDVTNCPDDPRAANQYSYVSNGSSGPTASRYVLWAQIENAPGVLWVVCSTGRSGYTTTAPTSYDCPNNISDTILAS